MTDRIDELLDRYLETGDLPGDATARERDEIVRMVAVMERARAVRPNIRHETRVTMPTARARFERFVAANPAPAGSRSQAATMPRRAWWRTLRGMPRGFIAIGAAAVIAVLAVVGTFAFQNLSATTETAAAAVLTPGDYTQVEGTVSSVDGSGSERVLVVESLLGRIRVAIPAETPILGVDPNMTSELIRPGAAVLIGGLVNDDRTIAAQSVALGAAPIREQRAATRRELIAEPPPIVEGTINLITVAQGLGRGKLVVVTFDSRFALPIEGATAARLLAADAAVIGARVKATRDSNSGLYSVQLVTREGSLVPAPASDASLARITGILAAREGASLTVQTATGRVIVMLRPETRILLGESGLVLGDVRRGEGAIGHEVTVHGSMQPGSGRIVADVIAVGPKVQR